MSIRIGDNNKISNSQIGHNNVSNSSGPECAEKKNFIEKHPILISVIVSLATGFVLLFSFWKDIVDWIEGLFK